MHWVLQSNMYHEDSFERLLSVLTRLEVPHSVHKLVPFSHELVPDVCSCPCHVPGSGVMHFMECCSRDAVRVSGKIVVMGTYTMTELAKKERWSPGAFNNENFDYEFQLMNWGSSMLNHGAMFGTILGIRNIRGDQPSSFVRPVLDSKDFAGEVMSWQRYESFRNGVLDLRPEDGATMSGDTRIMVCEQKDIWREWRVWMVDTKAVTASLYKEGRRVRYDDRVDSRVLEFAEEMASRWSPSRAYCLDVAETPEGLKIIEVNTLNSSGWYAADMFKLVAALETAFNE